MDLHDHCYWILSFLTTPNSSVSAPYSVISTISRELKYLLKDVNIIYPKLLYVLLVLISICKQSSNSILYPDKSGYLLPILNPSFSHPYPYCFSPFLWSTQCARKGDQLFILQYEYSYEEDSDVFVILSFSSSSFMETYCLCNTR